MQKQTGRTPIRLPLMDAAFCLAILAGVANFGYHALQGEFGILAAMAVEADEKTLQAELDALAAERARLENLTARLGVGALDLDLLDETARATLGLIRADEVIPR